MLQSPIHWENLDSTKRHFEVTGLKEQLDSYLFGVSTEAMLNSGIRVSSGLTWSNCIYVRNMSKYRVLPGKILCDKLGTSLSAWCDFYPSA